MKFGWAYIGAGNIARTTAKAITATGEQEIAAVYNRTFERAEEFARIFGGRACKTIDEALQTPGAMGAYIATTHDHHFEDAKRCIELGIPTLVEKAFTVTSREARELFSLAENRGVYIAEAMWTWFSPVARQVKSWVLEGRLGKTTEAEFRYAVKGASWLPRIFDPNTAGGALLDIGVYPIAYAYNIFGKPESVSCEGTIEDGIDAEETVLLKYPGIEVKCVISLVNEAQDESVSLKGSEGEVFCENFHYANSVTLHTKAGKETFTGNGGYDNEFSLAAAEIREGKTQSAYVPKETTLGVMEIMDECRAQMGLVYPFER